MELKNCYLLGRENVDRARRLLAEQQPGHWGHTSTPYPALHVSLPPTRLLTQGLLGAFVSLSPPHLGSFNALLYLRLALNLLCSLR